MIQFVLINNNKTGAMDAFHNQINLGVHFAFNRIGSLLNIRDKCGYS